MLNALLFALTLVGATLSGAFNGFAEDWPTRQITMVVPFPAGGGSDFYGRVFAARLAELLGQPVVVENVPGSGGVIGAARVARAPADGYSVLLGSAGTHAISQSVYKTPPYNSAIDFEPVALLAEQPLALIARKDLPANNLQEFIAYAKTNQAKMQYGSDSGVGSSNHLVCVLLNNAIGVNVTLVPYRGNALQDLLAGRIDYLCPNVSPGIISQVESQSVKAIAVLSKARSPVLPNLASAHEQGLTDFVGETWQAFFFPKGTPAPIVKRLHDAVIAAMETPSVQQQVKNAGGAIVASERRSPEYLRKFVESEIARWAGAIKASGVSVD